MKKNGIYKVVRLITAASVAAIGLVVSAQCKIISADELSKQYLQLDNGVWHYYSNNRLDMNFRGLAYDEKVGWWYVENGAINFNYNGLAQNEYGWWKISNGTVDFSYTGLVYDEKVGWWYVENGAINFNYNGLAQNEYGWWKISNGTVDFSYTGLVCDEKVGWWYVENGAINFNYNGLAQNEYGWWKISNGTVDFSYTGLAYDEKVGWWYVENGTINFNYNGLAQNEYGNWKIINGMVDFGYNGTYEGKVIVNGWVVSEESAQPGESEEDYDGYDRFGNKFVVKLEGVAYNFYFDADNPYTLDTYEWTEDGLGVKVIKDLGVFPNDEWEEHWKNMSELVEPQLEKIYCEKYPWEDRYKYFTWSEKDNCYIDMGHNPCSYYTQTGTSLGCYNGHWIIEYICCAMDIQDDYWNQTAEPYFYGKDGKRWSPKSN